MSMAERVRKQEQAVSFIIFLSMDLTYCLLFQDEEEIKKMFGRDDDGMIRRRIDEDEVDEKPSSRCGAFLLSLT